MDLATTREQLDDEGHTYKDFFSNVQLIWDNCKTYNVSGSVRIDYFIDFRKSIYWLNKWKI